MPSISQIAELADAHKIISTLIIAGFLIFLVPFFQLPGAALLLAGSFLNVASGRTKRRKMLWLLPMAMHLLLVLAVAFVFPK